MEMTCPHCGLRGKAEEGLLGKKVRCPECQKVFRVSEDVAKVASPAEVPVSQPIDSQVDNSAVAEDIALADSDEQTPVEDKLPEGVVKCENCGFSISAKFTQVGESGTLCAICSG